jgi:hypothetical protein
MSNLAANIIETLSLLYPKYANIVTIILETKVTLTYCARNKYVLFSNTERSVLFAALLNPPPLTDFSKFQYSSRIKLEPQNSIL